MNQGKAEQVVAIASVLEAARALMGDGAAVARAARARALRIEAFIVDCDGFLFRSEGDGSNAVNEIQVIIQWSSECY